MASTDSIQYRIADHIVTTMKLIKVSGGYKYTVPDNSCLLAASIMESPDLTKPSCFVDIADASPEEDQGHTIVWRFGYVVSFFNNHIGENPNINSDNANVIADVIKALKADVTRGGLCHYTEVGQCGPAYDMDTGRPYMYVNVECLTTLNATNPYST